MLGYKYATAMYEMECIRITQSLDEKKAKIEENMQAKLGRESFSYVLERPNELFVAVITNYLKSIGFQAETKALNSAFGILIEFICTPLDDAPSDSAGWKFKDAREKTLQRGVVFHFEQIMREFFKQVSACRHPSPQLNIQCDAEDLADPIALAKATESMAEEGFVVMAVKSEWLTLAPSPEMKAKALQETMKKMGL